MEDDTWETLEVERIIMNDEALYTQSGGMDSDEIQVLAMDAIDGTVINMNFVNWETVAETRQEM